MIGKYTKVLLALSFAKGVGSKTIIAFAKSLNTENYNLKYDSVVRESHNKRIQKISQIDWNVCLSKAENEIKAAEETGVNIISYLDEEYPKNLLSLSKAPAILYVMGNYKILNHDKIVAIIGTRKPSNYGVKIGKLFAETLSKDDFVIVGGLAKGCDTVAHAAAINSGGKTIAILGAGLDQPIYPKVNTTLAKKIVSSGGALVSTFAFGTQLSKYTLASRDEWQSGISDGVLAIETGIKGGTRIAMHHAVEQKRSLAVIDYRQSKRKEFQNLPTFEGNLDAINNENAIPIFSKKSLREFENIMIENHRKRLENLSSNK